MPIAAAERRSGYAECDGLVVYDQIRGAGRLGGVLHGAPMTLDELLPDLAKHRRATAVPHRRTAAGRSRLPDEQAASRVPHGRNL